MVSLLTRRVVCLILARASSDFAYAHPPPLPRAPARPRTFGCEQEKRPRSHQTRDLGRRGTPNTWNSGRYRCRIRGLEHGACGITLSGYRHSRPCNPVKRYSLRSLTLTVHRCYVHVSQEELEVRSDGTRSVIRPSRLTLARVSVLRGQGPKEGVPFIDEHIHTREPVVDYLTQFSGILRESLATSRTSLFGRATTGGPDVCPSPTDGDLTPETSKHTLVPLKMAYKKLRLLVELGCVFIGHGLKKDFRIISE